jgi:DNA-binding MarR family transcriptional regulator
MTRLVDRMVGAGWARRTEVESDRRATWVASAVLLGGVVITCLLSV